MSLNSLQDDMSRRAASMAAMAKRASNPQEIQAIQKSLITGVQDGSIQPYIGIPLIQDLTKKLTEAKAQMAQNVVGAGMPQTPQAAPVAQQVMQQAEQNQGVEALPSNLPQEYAGGGIIAFAGGGETQEPMRFQNAGLVPNMSGLPAYSATNPNAALSEFLKQLGVSTGEYANAKPEVQKNILDMFRSVSETPKPATPITTPTAPATPPTASAGSAPYRAGQAVGQAVRGGASGAGNFLSRGLIGTIGGPATAGIGAFLTPSPIADDQAVLAALRGESYRGQPYDVVSARKTLEAAGIDPNKAVVQPTPAEAAAYGNEGRRKPSEKSGGIDTLLGGAGGAGGAGAGAGAGSMSLGKGQSNLLVPPTDKSTEAFAREQFKGLGDRSEERISALIAAQNANKMEGKPFDELKKMLQEEAAQAGAEKSDAKNMAIFKAGALMMGGTSRNALENISKGIVAGAEDYQKAAADLKKADKERQKQFAAIEEARRAEDRDDLKTRNARLESAYIARQRSDELGANAISAGFGVDKAQATDIWKTQFSGAKSVEVANIGAGATLGAARIGADSRVQAAELKAAMAGLGEGKGAFTQDQLVKNRRELAESPQIAAFKKDLINQYGKNVVNQPGYQEAVNKQIDQLLMQMSARPGAASGLDNNTIFKSFLNNNPGIQQYFK